MQTCVPTHRVPAPTSQPRLVRRATGTAQPCTACGYHPPLPYASHGPAQS